MSELSTMEVHFDQPVAGVDAADLLVNGVPATGVTQPVEAQFVWTFASPPPGLVTFAWAASHGISARDDAGRTLVGGTWTCQLDPTTTTAHLLISEFMASNERTLRDEDGDNSDWIELFNAGDEAASLDGWFLTDDPLQLSKWRLPNVNLGARSYLIVFASEKNRTNATGRLHTNFKLADSGEYLALLSPDTNVVSAFAPAYPRQAADISFGRTEGEPDLTGYFVQPTPGTQNSSSGPGFAPEPGFSREGGLFTGPFELRLTTSSTNALIRYTLDGSAPTNTSPVYAGPIAVTNSLLLRARAWQDGLLPGPVRSQGFVLATTAAAEFTSPLPVVVLHSLGRGAPTSSRMNFTHLTVFEPVNGVAALANRPAFTTRAGIQVRGSSTEGLAKASYKLELWDEFNLDRDVSLLGLPPDSDWVLYAPNNFDVPLIHNPFIHRLSRDVGRYSSRTRFVEVYQNKATGALGANHYAGIYVLEEKIKVSATRVDIGKLEPENIHAPEVTGGYLMKFDRLDPGDSGISAAGATAGLVDPKERELKQPARKPQLDYLRGHLAAFSSALNGSNWLDPQRGYAAYLDVAACIDFHVLEVLSGNVDALVLSTYFHKPRGAKIAFGPHWDFDRALGSTDGRDANPRNWSTGPFFNAPWWSRLLRDVDFWQLWVDRWQELRGTHLARTNLNRLIDELAGEVRPAQPREYARWHIRPRKANGTAGGTYDTEIQWMKNWLSNRVDFIDRQLTQPPQLSSAGGIVLPSFPVQLTGPAGATLFYTLDGSDPRAPRGGVSPTALTHSAGQPIPIVRNTRLVVRARDLARKQAGGPPVSTPWSAPVAATFLVDPPQVLLTEIMFHPAAPSAGGTNPAGDFEFLELQNAGTTALDLTGFRLTNGVDFVFTAANLAPRLAPGERVLVVKNRVAFAARYPGVTNIAGEFAGSLSNAGNRVRLVGSVGETVFDVAYRDGWQALADGAGFSLVLGDETINPAQLDSPEHWRLSAHVGGSPGAQDAPPAPVPRVRVNEVVANPAPEFSDAIELLNPEDMPADISGWWVSDDRRSPRKFRVPAGTVIAPGGYHVLRASEFSGGTSGFGFSQLGDEACLFSADAKGELTGWLHILEFGAQEAGRSFSRRVASDGRETAVPTDPTLGMPNARPDLPAVALLEVMSQPPSVNGFANPRDQFIEIGDLGAPNPPLAAFDLDHPGSGWRIRGSVEFDFPAGFQFPSNRLAVIVGFDPERDSAGLAAFRAAYRLESSVAVLGPWRGQLPAANAHVRLLKPLPPVPAAVPGGYETPYALVEEVSVRTQAPWPADTAGTGRSLVRRLPLAFADEPDAWTSWFATPGDADQDGDRLPDGWETANHLNPALGGGADGRAGDPDGDGFTNAQEYIAGTAADNPGEFPRLDVELTIDGRVRLAFRSGPSRTYTIQWRETTGPGDWQVLRRLTSPPEAGQTVFWWEVPSEAARFYRLSIP